MVVLRKQKDGTSSSSSSWFGMAIVATIGFLAGRSWSRGTFAEYTLSPLEVDRSNLPSAGSAAEVAPVVKSSGRLLTVSEIKQSMRLPCNFAHDGFYVQDSNEVLNQVYQTIMNLEDHIIPIVIESGGHDGITKSLSLKASACLNMNTLLLEASPSNFNVLRQSRAYDFTVNAALCEEESVRIIEDKKNSGGNKVGSIRENGGNAATIPCTTIDKELDKLAQSLPASQRSNLKLIFHILDIEGYEAVAVRGIQKYPPTKAMIEWKNLKPDKHEAIEAWAAGHNLIGKVCGQDMCFNYGPTLTEKPDHLKSLLYGARKTQPKNIFMTSQVSPAYMYYGE